MTGIECVLKCQVYRLYLWICLQVVQGKHHNVLVKVVFIKNCQRQTLRSVLLGSNHFEHEITNVVNRLDMVIHVTKLQVYSINQVNLVDIELSDSHKVDVRMGQHQTSSI